MSNVKRTGENLIDAKHAVSKIEEELIFTDKKLSRAQTEYVQAEQSVRDAKMKIAQTQGSAGQDLQRFKQKIEERLQQLGTKSACSAELDSAITQLNRLLQAHYLAPVTLREAR